MSALKLVADYVPKDKQSITVGEVYDAKPYSHGYLIENDYGITVFVLLAGCSHLGGGSWRIVK